MMMRSVVPLGRLAVSLALAAGLSGCSFFRDLTTERKPPLPGERVSVLSFDQRLEPEAEASGAIELPKPYVNTEWPQAGGYPAHAMYHLALGAEPQRLWRASVGDGSSSNTRLVASPVVADGIAFAYDTAGRVTAVSVADGSRLWRVDLTPEDEDSDKGFRGGVGYDGGRLYAATGFGLVVALDAKTGKEIWRHSVGVPLRSAPTINGGRVFAITQDNQLFALNALTGEVLWNHQGIAESAGLLSSSSPAVAGDTVVAAYSSGEIFALRVENGRVAWSDTLSRQGRMTPLAALNDISGQPVIDRGRVFALSHSGRMVSIDLRTGERQWDKTIAGTQTPWVAGNYVYVVTTEADLVCLGRDDGKIHWVTHLGQFDDAVRKEDPIYWSGPVLAGDRLIVTSSNGFAVSISPYTGEVLGRLEMPTKILIPPIVADGTLFVLTDDADLIALK
jgi:outer membrane protein assembly factor BamB